MALEDEIHARLRELTEEVRKSRESLRRPPTERAGTRALDKRALPSPTEPPPERDREP